ncbi:MAG: preprotein translocase subunit SecY [Peptococcaceae bacterium]|nr:preprotein translocase subunit SecY [Peptococcaceae bacterium]
MAILDTLRNAWSTKSIRNKIIFTLLMLLIFRIGAHIPVPFINREALQQMFEGEGAATMMSFLNTFSGGALKNFSVFALSIIPYVTSSIIMNLLTVVIPSLGRLAKEGEDGRRKITQYTRYGTIILGFVQGMGMTVGLMRPYLVVPEGALMIPTFFLIALVLTAGTAFLMWLGEQITEKGIGNGISLIIFAGIVAGIPDAVKTIVPDVLSGAIAWYQALSILVIGTILIAGVVFVQEGQRKIPVQYAKRVVGRKVYGGQSTHIPLKVNQAGVIPLIFGFSIMNFPMIIGTWFPQGSAVNNFIGTWLTMDAKFEAIPFLIFFALLIVFFTYFYTGITFNPVDVADNLKKNGGFIPGIRPGRPTSDYLSKILTRVTLAGGVFLAAIALLPMLIQVITGIKNAQIGGTSLLIVVSVALDTMKQLESQLLQRNYSGFIK